LLRGDRIGPLSLGSDAAYVPPTARWLI
jgi:hypothetical protein